MFFEMEFLECELMVRNLKEKQENYSKASVEVRICMPYFMFMLL